MHVSVRLVSLAMAALAVTAVGAQDLRAIVEDGRKVILSPNGKWHFDTSAPRPQAPATGGMQTLSTAVKKFSVAYDSDAWTLAAAKEGGVPNKRAFAHKTLPIHGMVIADEIPASNAAMRNVILHNARGVGSEPTVLLEQQTDIGGNAVGMIRFAVATTGLEFVFSVYYLGTPEGNVQVTCYTAQSLYHKHEAECKKFMDGLTIK